MQGGEGGNDQGRGASVPRSTPPVQTSSPPVHAGGVFLVLESFDGRWSLLLSIAYFGSTMVFDEPSGAACMPGGDCPWGLSAGAPPLPVVIGPVQPCG